MIWNSFIKLIGKPADATQERAKQVAATQRLAELDKELAETKAKIDALMRHYRTLQQERTKILRAMERAAQRIVKSVGRAEIEQRVFEWAEDQVNRESFMEDIIRGRFQKQTERSYGGTKWAKLAKSTISGRGGSGSPILRDSGDMFASAVDAVHGTFKRGGEGAITWDAAKDMVGADYATFHMTGTTKMPARRFFLSPNARELAPALARYRELVRKKMRETGL